MIRNISLSAVFTIALCAAIQFAATGIAVADSTVYSSLPVVETYNLPSLGYQATSTQEFGDDIVLAGSARNLTSITIGMSSWAVSSDFFDGTDPLPGYESIPMTSAGYTHPLTVNVYSVDHSGPTPAVGSLLATDTVSAFIPWRPGTGSTWTAPDNNEYSGLYFTTNFDLSSSNVVLPNEVIVALAFNTQTHGYDPIGAAGPYNSLNFALSPSSEPHVGTDADSDATFWNTSFAGFYSDGGVAGVGVLRQDTEWSGYVPSIQVNAVPEPSTFVLGGLGLLGLALLRLRRKG